MQIHLGANAGEHGYGSRGSIILDQYRRSRVWYLLNGAKAMSVANQQIEGLLMAIASINHILVRKGLLTTQEIDIALRKAEASEAGGEGSDNISPSDRDSVASRSGCCNWPTNVNQRRTCRRFQNWR